MNKLQYFGFFISLGYMFYVLWWNYNYENFFKKNHLLINLSICICWATFGLVSNYSVQSASFIIPLFLIFLIRMFDLLSIKFFDRHFHPWSGKGVQPANADIADALLTLLVILLNTIIPVIILNLVINGRMFD